ncbi:pentatricopeptide repeat-containing protein At3g42630 [Ricinus communis]|uniref:Pentatricopeptide repeat-containing protein, putative n=1 Tax=Ricinus communis TaxID=3988 RepID=B9RDM7_RICCO|nr:pentatricopeptide repeat-containing protein At3g42630 [Ricinus communis]EEF50485.1 pentatricopeptide repeat-containing protein, putative [Ricinus communis]|eukprot:XP_002511816.1 pentatricopeptide repeat-containing protein At3g42630 [Ricinus communis]
MDAQSVIVGSSLPDYLGGSLKRKMGRFRLFSSQRDPTNRPLARKIIYQWKQDQSFSCKEVDCASLVQNLHSKRTPHLAQEILLEMKSQGYVLNNPTLSAILLCYADNGLLPQAQAIWKHMLNGSFTPSIQIVSRLIDAYSKKGHFNEVMNILDQLSYSNFSLLHEAYSLAISCFGKGGQLQLMENALKDMVLRGFPVDYATGNAFIRYYSIHGSLTDMESAYSRLKRSRHLVDREGIRAVSLAYVKERKFYRLGEFLRDVGLGRKDVGNLIWNFLLLSFAANFKMKSLQREFLRMLEAGFHPDVTTFNIRALAFSRMSLLWDLHLTLEHMKHEKVSPDIVTYGCIVDAYLDRRLGKNLDFAIKKMNLDGSPVLLTDPFVFEVLGKGDFHSSAEAFLEFKRQRKWTYRELVSIYLRKQYRSNQIFWNY